MWFSSDSHSHPPNKGCTSVVSLQNFDRLEGILKIVTLMLLYVPVKFPSRSMYARHGWILAINLLLKNIEQISQWRNNDFFRIHWIARSKQNKDG